VRQFAETHGGTIAVDEAPGGGALFTLRLPTLAVDDDEPAPRDLVRAQRGPL
jgi:signal transduction histidine kinase